MTANSSLHNLFRNRADAELVMAAAGTAVTAGNTTLAPAATGSVYGIDLQGGTPYTLPNGQTANAWTLGAIHVQFSDVNTPTSNDTLTITVQVSNSATFASGNRTIYSRVFNDAENNTHPRRLVIPFLTQDHDLNFRYVRLSIASANNATAAFSAYIAPAEG